MRNASSMPLAVVGGTIVVGVVVAVAAVFRAYEVGQSLDVVMPGRTATILHIVLRGAMVNVVLCAAFLIACWRYWRIPGDTWRKLLPVLLIAKLGAAVLPLHLCQGRAQCWLCDCSPPL